MGSKHWEAKTCDVIKTSNASNMGLDLKYGTGLKQLTLKPWVEQQHATIAQM